MNVAHYNKMIPFNSLFKANCPTMVHLRSVDAFSRTKGQLEKQHMSSDNLFATTPVQIHNLGKRRVCHPLVSIRERSLDDIHQHSMLLRHAPQSLDSCRCRGVFRGNSSFFPAKPETSMKGFFARFYRYVLPT